MTEDEAKTKTCPTISYCVNELGVIQDRDAPLYAQATCIGSACMAWRSRPAIDVTRARAELAAGNKINAIKALRESFPEYGLLEAKQVIEGSRPWPNETSDDGFCGLAGRP